MLIISVIHSMQNYVLCLKDLCGKTEMNVQVFFCWGIKWVGWEQGMKKSR